MWQHKLPALQNYLRSAEKTIPVSTVRKRFLVYSKNDAGYSSYKGFIVQGKIYSAFGYKKRKAGGELTARQWESASASGLPMAAKICGSSTTRQNPGKLGNKAHSDYY